MVSVGFASNIYPYFQESFAVTDAVIKLPRNSEVILEGMTKIAET